MTIWMKVTKDEFELPIVVADTAGELAEKCGVKRKTILSWISHYRGKKGEWKWCPYIRIDVEDDDEEE